MKRSIVITIAALCASPSAFAEYWSCRAGAAETPNVLYVSNVIGPIPVVTRVSPLLDMRGQFAEFLKQKYSVRGSAECWPSADAAAAEAAKKGYADYMVTQHGKVIETGWKYAPVAPAATVP